MNGSTMNINGNILDNMTKLYVGQYARWQQSRCWCWSNSLCLPLHSHYKLYLLGTCFMLLITSALMMPFSSAPTDPVRSFRQFTKSKEAIDSSFNSIRRSISASVVKIKYGLLRGLILNLDQITSSSNGTRKELRLQPVKAYLGIPYASPPTGALRFMPPVTPAHWRGVRIVDQLQPLCPQKIPYVDLVLNASNEALKRMPLARFEWLRRIIPRMSNQSEDCLYLNIYSPDLGSDWPEIRRTSSVNNLNDLVDDNDEESTSQNKSNENDQTISFTRLKRYLGSFSSSLSLPWTKMNELYETQNETYQHEESNFFLSSWSTFNQHRSLASDRVSKITRRQTAYVGHQSKQPKQQTFPVVVFLTGESYEWNPGSLFDGSLLASFGQVVVVTLNFRLGILGFLPATIDGTIRGNYGLMDQVAALHWIQENIGEFGGSASNVTLIGHGHGAACAHLLMLSPMAKGLFKRVILMSGSALSPWAIARDASLYAEQVGRQLNCPLKENSLVIDCLRTKSIHKLQSVQYQVPDHLAGFGPIIDGIVIPKEPRILLHQMRENIQARQQQATNLAKSERKKPTPVPWSTLAAHMHRMHSVHSSSTGHAGSLNHIKASPSGFPSSNPDLMVGVTRVEVPVIFNSQEELNGISVARRDRLLRTLVRNLFDYHQQAIFYTLVNEYTDWTKPADSPLNRMDSLMELYSDGLVVAPLIESLDHHYAQSILLTSASSSSSSSLHGSGVYFYVFAYQNGHFSKQRFHERLGAPYGDDLAFIFGVPLVQTKLYEPEHNDGYGYRYPTFDISPNWYPLNSKLDINRTIEIELCQKFISFWINFVMRGDPNTPTQWTSNEPHSRHQHKFLSSDSNRGSAENRRKNNVPPSWHHDRWISSYGYQTVHTSQTRNSAANYQSKVHHWPHYDTLQRRYVQFGSSIEPGNHYHSHRLSVWLSLIPRLHAPIELKELSLDEPPLSTLSQSLDQKSVNANPNDYQLEKEQFFYLKHHLLPDHENLETYDGIVKKLSIRVPESKQWQQTHLRRNITSWYEQHQQMLYGSIYETDLLMALGVSSPRFDDSLFHLDSVNDSNGKSKEQYARHQIETVNTNSKKLFKIENIKVKQSNVAISNNNITNSSLLHYETQMTVETYSTLVLVSFVIGGALFLLNVIIVIGVYLKMKNGAKSDVQPLHSECLESTNKLPNKLINIKDSSSGVNWVEIEDNLKYNESTSQSRKSMRERINLRNKVTSCQSNRTRIEELLSQADTTVSGMDSGHRQQSATMVTMATITTMAPNKYKTLPIKLRPIARSSSTIKYCSPWPKCCDPDKQTTVSKHDCLINMTAHYHGHREQQWSPMYSEKLSSHIESASSSKQCSPLKSILKNPKKAVQINERKCETEPHIRKQANGSYLFQQTDYVIEKNGQCTRYNAFIPAMTYTELNPSPQLSFYQPANPNSDEHSPKETEAYSDKGNSVSFIVTDGNQDLTQLPYVTLTEMYQRHQQT